MSEKSTKAWSEIVGVELGEHEAHHLVGQFKNAVTLDIIHASPR
jgi:hypothetical protein